MSLPTIGRDLHFSETNLQWVATAYALTFGGFLLLGGRCADLLGRRRILMLGIGVFTAASLGCALAAGEAQLIAMRAAQGVGAALMIPAALSIVMNMFREGAERNKALGIWGGLGAGGGTVGLIAGGLITRYLGWQYIFYLNIPIGAGRTRTRSPDRARQPARGHASPVRRAGAVSGTGGLVLLVDAVSEAPQYGWGATRTIVLLGAARRRWRVPGDRESQRGPDDPAVDLPAARPSPPPTSPRCCSARASSRSCSPAPSTCRRCSTTARCRPGPRGWPPR